MAELEQLSLYSACNEAEDVFYVRNYPVRGARMAEHAAVETLASAGWRLVSTAATRAHRVGHNTSRLLNLERLIDLGTADVSRGRMRLQRSEGMIEVLRGVPRTRIGQVVRAKDGLLVKFLGVTRVANGIPDYGLLGRDAFAEDGRRPLTGVVSINGAQTTSVEQVADDLHCQFLHCSLDGSYRDDVHQPEAIALRVYGLMVGVPFGETYLRAMVPFRSSKFEYVIFRGDRELGRASEVLVRFPFEIVPR
jgi:hypothetical protein